MSIPKFPDVPPGYTINDSIAQIITSIAMEEIGLSHIINAEGEKLQYILGTLEGRQLQQQPTLEQILEVNESVKGMLGQVSFSQMFLMGKMQAALNAYQDNPIPPPTPDASSILVAGGYGTDQSIPMYVLTAVKFNSPPVLQIGNDITENADGDIFTIGIAGEYLINYQMAAYTGNPLVTINTDVRLTSNSIGVIDSVNLNQQHVVNQSSVTVNLQAGDQIRLNVIENADVGTILINSQVITFTKVG